ncbi:uncharacterized protein [Nicotiana sylvestris]|uniref:uncharacterized protein n=1 Tax=Nicotiana sylvestris TaxID=4096 RepID=UPI00388C4B4A
MATAGLLRFFVGTKVSNVNQLNKASIVEPSSSRKVLLPNGDVTKVTRVGDSQISKSNTLKEDIFNGRVNEIVRERDAQRLTSQPADIALWHMKLGHVSIIVLKKLFPVKLGIITNVINKCCVCPSAKLTGTPFSTSSIKSTSAFDLIHFIAFVHTQFNKIVKMVRFNNGTEFLNSVCRTVLNNLGILHQTTCAYSPQHNGVVERKHRHLLEITRALRFQAHIPIKFWGYCVITAAYLINRLPSSVLKGCSPYELLYNRKPQLGHLKTSGCLCFARDVSFRKDVFPLKDYLSVSPPIFMPPSSPHSCEEVFSDITFSTIMEPFLYEEAAIKTEIAVLEANHTWKVVSLPSGKMPIGCKWIFKEYYEQTGTTNNLDDALLPYATSYQRLLGKLIYLTVTRPDIAFSVQILTQFMKKPKKSHMEAALRVIKYVKNHPGQGVLLSSQKKGVISAFGDADWVACPFD